ncbi:MAG: hypothetical protein CM15mP84_04130 [Cellvibrionales bacterium]|nr:MAG: hypothetical protein CM15mP84_04130 [Cellvibrionales bacterium]
MPLPRRGYTTIRSTAISIAPSAAVFKTVTSATAADLAMTGQIQLTKDYD